MFFSSNLVLLDLDLDPDPDSDPHSEKLLDPDPHKMNADPHSTALISCNIILCRFLLMLHEWRTVSWLSCTRLTSKRIICLLLQNQVIKCLLKI